MTFELDKTTGTVFYDDGDTQYFIKTDATTTRDAWSDAYRKIRERSKPPLRLYKPDEDNV